MNEIKPYGNGYENGLQAGRAVAGHWQPSSTSRLVYWIETIKEAPTIICEDR
jgi:hypothetical protein